MSEEKIPSPHMRPVPLISFTDTPLLHRDGSVEHEYLIDASPDLPSIRVRIFTFPNGDAQVEAEFTGPDPAPA
jgi:hypothetical protein